MQISITINEAFRMPVKIALSDEPDQYSLQCSGIIRDALHKPRLLDTTYPLIKEEWDSLLKELNCTLDIVPEFAMGLDGNTYIIKIENGWSSVKYRIWGKEERDQHPLCRFVHKVMNTVREKSATDL